MGHAHAGVLHVTAGPQTQSCMSCLHGMELHGMAHTLTSCSRFVLSETEMRARFVASITAAQGARECRRNLLVLADHQHGTVCMGLCMEHAWHHAHLPMNHGQRRSGALHAGWSVR